MLILLLLPLLTGAQLTGEVKVNGVVMDHKSFSKVSGKEEEEL